MNKIMCFLIQASQFFHSAQSSAAAQHKEFESHILGEGSVDRPLLLEQEMTTDPLNQVKLGFVSGLVGREKSMAFE
ncbi:V-type proton ATPase subunit a3-like [Olea europaea subsp. europaea]|uniref:V-type proton ATPase subunit a3-like n=1 Tax=Olea europaea subsp. europaea TaxID=158383 RepID=A0A8S0QBZ6_OLEEU|nr:V-type proton ATPase subunit a3-like [Olea europaea subsp. europaea]